MADKQLLQQFGRRIRELLAPLLPEEGWMRSRRGGGRRGLSQEKLAELTGFHRTAVDGNEFVMNELFRFAIQELQYFRLQSLIILYFTFPNNENLPAESS